METDIFVVTIKGISIEGFEEIIVSATVAYKGEEYTHDIPVKVPIFMSNGNVIIGTAVNEAYWKMCKHWKRLNENAEPLPKQDIKAFEDLVGTPGTSE